MEGGRGQSEEEREGRRVEERRNQQQQGHQMGKEMLQLETETLPWRVREGRKQEEGGEGGEQTGVGGADGGR
eukprot:758365-Hanusia_phi.AAC.2